MQNKSIWTDTIKINPFPKLDKNIKTDILVIGGGISGILCTYELQKRGKKVILVEKNRIASKVTQNTTAFITAQHENLYQDIIKDNGLKLAKEYLDLNLKAVEEYQKLNELYHFDYQECSSILYSSQSSDLILKEQAALKKLNYHAEIINELPEEISKLGVTIKSGIKFKNQAVINPLKLISELSKELTIYENTEIDKLIGNVAYVTNTNINISFNNVVICTHFPFINKFGLYFMKMHQRLSYVLAIKSKPIKNTYCSIDEEGMYFRSYQNYLIIGGNDRDHKEKLKLDLKKQLNLTIKPEYEWINQDCITLDKLPYIGKYDIFHPNRYVVTGFNMWGFTLAMVSSWIISDEIEKKKTYKIFNPQRNMFKKQLFLNLTNTLKNLLTFKKPRCTHLGCKLNYNHQDKTWECPCHGSRFDQEGNIINTPSRKNLN